MFQLNSTKIQLINSETKKKAALEQIKKQASPLQEKGERFGLREDALGRLHYCRIRAYFSQIAVQSCLSVGYNSVSA